MQTRLSEIDKTLRRLETIEELKKLFKRHEYYFTSFQMNKCLSLWSKRRDSMLEVPWGCYDGYDGLRRYFLVDWGDISEKENREYYRGCVLFRSVDTDIVVPAEDEMTARACWSSQGFEVYGNKVELAAYRGESFVSVFNYAVDFIREDGAWRIWHMRQFNKTHTPHHTGWTEYDQPFQGHILKPTHCDRPPSRPVYYYRGDAVIPGDEPDPPKPYACFADVAPGYGAVYEPEGEV